MGGFCPGGFCPGGFCPRGILSRGILSGGFCPGGFVRGDFVLEPDFCPPKKRRLLPLKFSKTIERTIGTITYCFKNNGLLSP